MPVFRMTQEINRPMTEVFDTVIHVENFPAWSPQNPSARRVSSGPIGEGSRFVMEIKGFGHVPQELQEFETNRRVRIVPDIPQLAGGHRFKFTDLGGRTRVDHEMEMNPKGFYRLMGPMMWFIGRRNLRITADALKHHLESAH